MAKNLERIEAEITLKDNGFTDAIKRVNQKTTEYKQKAESTSTSNEKLASSFRSAAQGIAVVDGPLGGIASRFSSTASLISGTSLAVVGFGSALAGVALLMSASVSAGEQMERQLYKQEAVLRATGYAAGFNAQQLDQMARQTAFATLASVEDIREAQNVMMTFRRVQGDIFTEAVGLTQDLAVVMGGSAASNAKMLGRALEDPITGVTALTRAGVSFSTQQKEVIKDLVETGNRAEAQRLILAELQKQVGGVGSGEAQGLSGAIDTLGQQFQTLFENIDKTTGAGKALSDFLNRIAKGVGRTADLIEEDEKEANDRLVRLFNERLNAQMEYDNATNERQRKAAQLRLDSIDQEMGEITAQQRKAAEEQVGVWKKSKETQRQLEQQEAAERLATQQAEGLKSVSALELSLESQQEKIARQHQERMASLQNLVLSEEELEQRGFGTITALRDAYGERLQEQYSSELKALQDKIASEQAAKEQAAARDEARRQRDAEREQKQQERAKERAEKLFESVEDTHVRMFGTSAEYEDLRYEKQLQRLDDEKANVQSQQAWSLDQEKDYHVAREQAQEIHEERLKKIEEAELAARIQSQRNFANIFVGMAASKNKTLAAIGKAAAIYNIGLDTYEGAMAAYNAMASIPYVGPALGVAAAGAVIAFGAEQMAGVMSQEQPSYHTGGIAGLPSDNYGARLKAGEINATLMRGEEVLTADDPRHRNNLQVYESGNYGTSTSSSVSNSVTVHVDGASDPAAVAQQVAQEVNARLNSFVRSKSFQSATVGAVSRYAKNNAGRIPNTR